MAESPFSIVPVRSAEDLKTIRVLFREYAASLGVDLCFQGFEEELALLPGKYAPPMGELLLARNAEGEALGCVAVRPLGDAGVCEMKRLYVVPAGRGFGLGRALTDAILEVAERIGYREMRLDTLSMLVEAVSLYRKRGFGEIPAYYDTPLEGTVFMAKRLG